MSLFLSEDQVGSDQNMIGFPDLKLCMGMTVVMDDGSLIGAHISQESTEQALLNELKRKVEAHDSGMALLYFAANYTQHCRGTCKPVQGKANAIGFRGTAYLFDFGFINDLGGAYVEVTSNGAGQPASLRYKRSSKMDYSDRGPSRGTVSEARRNREDPTQFDIRDAPLPVVQSVTMKAGHSVWHSVKQKDLKAIAIG